MVSTIETEARMYQTKKRTQGEKSWPVINKIQRGIPRARSRVSGKGSDALAPSERAESF